MERAQHAGKRWLWTLQRNCGTVGLILAAFQCVLPTGETGHERVGNEGKAILGAEYDPKEIRKEMKQTKGSGGNASHRNMSGRDT